MTLQLIKTDLVGNSKFSRVPNLLNFHLSLVIYSRKYYHAGDICSACAGELQLFFSFSFSEGLRGARSAASYGNHTADEKRHLRILIAGVIGITQQNTTLIPPHNRCRGIKVDLP